LKRLYFPTFFLNIRKIQDYMPNEIVDIILVLGECHCNYQQAAELYHDRFSGRQHSNDGTIARLVSRQRQCPIKKR